MLPYQRPYIHMYSFYSPACLFKYVWSFVKYIFCEVNIFTFLFVKTDLSWSYFHLKWSGHSANSCVGEDVLKTSWRSLEDVFSVTFFRLPRRLQDVIKSYLQDIFEDVFRTSWRCFWRLFCKQVALLAASLKSMAHRWNVASLRLFCQLVPLPFSRERATRYSDRLHDYSVTIPWCHKNVCDNSFFLRPATL